MELSLERMSVKLEKHLLGTAWGYSELSCHHPGLPTPANQERLQMGLVAGQSPGNQTPPPWGRLHTPGAPENIKCR